MKECPPELLEPYFTTLQRMAKLYKVRLDHAFIEAGMSSATYYRNKNGVTEMRWDSARKVGNAIEKIHALQAARSYTRSLHRSGSVVSKASIRVRFVPRSFG